MPWHSSLYCVRLLFVNFATNFTWLFHGIGAQWFSNAWVKVRCWGPRGKGPKHSRYSSNHEKTWNSSPPPDPYQKLGPPTSARLTEGWAQVGVTSLPFKLSGKSSTIMLRMYVRMSCLNKSLSPRLELTSLLVVHR